MGMVKCKECGSEVSGQAKSCPNCGISSPGKKYGTKELCGGCCAGIFILFIISALMGGGSDTSSTTAPSLTTTPQPVTEASEKYTDSDHEIVIKSGLNYLDIDIESVIITDGDIEGGYRAIIIGYTSTTSSIEGLTAELATITGFIYGYEYGNEGSTPTTGADDISILVGDSVGNAVGVVGIDMYELKRWGDSGMTTSASERFMKSWDMTSF